jgi:hypothetical protein
VLVAAGVPDAIIMTSSVGEGTPQAVPTPDGTPNPKNRRVEVRFTPQAGPKLLSTPSPTPTTTLPTPGLGQNAGPILPTPQNDPGTGPFTKLPPDPVKHIKDLNDAFNAAAEGVAKDALVRQIRDGVDSIKPGTGKMIDDAIKAGVPAGIKAAIMAALQAITGQPGTTMPEDKDRTHTPWDMPPGVPGTKQISIPLPSPLDKAPPVHQWTSFQFRGGLRESYTPGATITFTVVPPSNFSTLTGVKRISIVSEAEGSQMGATRLDAKDLDSGSPQQITLTAPKAPGKYYVRAEVGGVPEGSSMQLFTVAAATVDNSKTY